MHCKSNKKVIIIIKVLIFHVLVSLKNPSKVIEIDNIINEPLYEQNLNFSNLETSNKILVIYYPENNEKKRITHLNNFNKSVIEKHILIAKNHGIYGFGIVYNIDYGFQYNEEILNLFSFDCRIKIPFFIIFTIQRNINNIYSKESVPFFIKSLVKYYIYDNYIKFKNKPIIGIFYISSLSLEIIRYIRKYEIDSEKKIFFIISIAYTNKNLEYLNSISNSSSYFIYQNDKERNKKYEINIYYYIRFNEEKLVSKNIKYFFMSNDCNPEKFFTLFKTYLNITKLKKDTYIIFNAWNDYNFKSVLDPNNKYGYSYLNYLSKALFNLDNIIEYNLKALNNNCKIAVQVHIFYKDLIKDIIDKTNNILVKFDLFLTIVTPEVYKTLNNYVKYHSKANNYQIAIVKNKGRDILPFINQMKSKFRQYKYICHIHTKKSKHNPKLGNLWRNYLFENLIGNANRVYEILNDFQKYDKLGFIFPEPYCEIIKYYYSIAKRTKKWMKFIISKLFKNYSLGELLDFPAGNMFWAKINAIFQIFDFDFIQNFPKEKKQKDSTIMHAIERIWLYLVKYNGYNYKTIFKYF